MYHKYMSNTEWMTNSTAKWNVGLHRQTTLRCKCAWAAIYYISLCSVCTGYVQSWYGSDMLFNMQYRSHWIKKKNLPWCPLGDRMSPVEVCSVELELTMSNTLPHGLSRVTSSQYRLPPSSKGLTVSQIHISYASIPAEIGLKSNNFYLVQAFNALDLCFFLPFSAFVVCVAPFAFTRFEFRLNSNLSTHTKHSMRRNDVFYAFFLNTQSTDDFISSTNTDRKTPSPVQALGWFCPYYGAVMSEDKKHTVYILGK